MPAIVCAAVVALGGTCLAAERVSFRREVMAVLSKAGCNQGACHGNQQGKNGFKLSLRGADPAADYASLTHEQFGRRVDRLSPEQSLIVEKALGTVPHGGGRRFAPDSLEYRTLVGWVAQGLRDDEGEAPKLVGLKVTPREQYLVEPERTTAIDAEAEFADGTRADVTRWAVFTPSNPLASVSADGQVTGERDGECTIVVRYLDRQATVRLAFVPARPDFVWNAPAPSNYIDELVFAKLRRLRMKPSPEADDVSFLRRAYLDAIGRPPTVDEAEAFLSDRAADKRAVLIDHLLEKPEFADFWALKWSDLLRNEEKALDRKGVQAFHHWIRQSIAEGKPLDRFVYELVSARGSTYSRPEANYYRASRDPITRAETTAQVFLGLRLQCAKCHNHPFDRWTQSDYYDWAGYFSRVEYKIIDEDRDDELDKHQFRGEQLIWVGSRGSIDNPRTGHPAKPRVLGSKRSPVGSASEACDEDPLETVARWITDPANPFFARAQANRVWFHLLGRGIVDPIDDFRATNLPVNEPLLDALAKDFVAHGYDLRQLVRTIMNSRTYQLSAATNLTNADDEANFSHAVVRPLGAEQLLDALHQATGVPARFRGYPAGFRAVELPGVSGRGGRRSRPGAQEQFLAKFGKPERLLSCECERSEETTLAQAFQLISGPTLADMLERDDNVIDGWLKSKLTNEQILDELYLRSLSRPPGAAERAGMIAYLERAKDRRAGLEDVFWAVLNSKEFLLRH